MFYIVNFTVPNFDNASYHLSQIEDSQTRSPHQKADSMKLLIYHHDDTG